MVIEDGSGKRVHLGFVDLMGGSPVVTERLVERLRRGGFGVMHGGQPRRVLR